MSPFNGGLDMTAESNSHEDQIRIIRDRSLAREACDPLPVCLLRLIIEELETDFLEATGLVARSNL